MTAPDGSSPPGHEPVVDVERLRRVLQRVSDDLAVLDRYAADPDAVRHDPARLGHVKYLFVTAIEGGVDAAHHVCASEGWGPPDSNADAVRTLIRHGVVPEEVGAAVALAAGFRNLLVHGYATVDDDRVVGHLAELDRLRAYVAALSTLVDPA